MKLRREQRVRALPALRNAAGRSAERFAHGKLQRRFEIDLTQGNRK
jgi:hypothetical protein